MFKIEKGIKIPPRGRGTYGHQKGSLISRMIDTMNEMKIDDSFIIKDSQYKTFSKILNYYNEFPNQKFITRREDKMRRIFRIK